MSDNILGWGNSNLALSAQGITAKISGSFLDPNWSVHDLKNGH